jgi:hypothetical protein
MYAVGFMSLQTPNAGPAVALEIGSRSNNNGISTAQVFALTNEIVRCSPYYN